jgi:hypothetical protein
VKLATKTKNIRMDHAEGADGQGPILKA